MKLRPLALNSMIAALGVFAVAAQAQTFPSKMITMIVPWPAGGATDAAGRLIANELKTSLVCLRTTCHW